MLKIVLAALAVVVVLRPAVAEEVVSTVQAPAPSKVTGLVDIRPSWKTKTGGLHTEDTFELGYQFRPGRTLSYAQYIETNLDSSALGEGVSPTLYDGFIRTRLSKLAESKDLGLALSFQNRAYVPITQASRDKGMIVTLRNYITLTKTVTENFSVSLSELPVIPIYDRPEAAGKANPVFENRVYLIGDLTITDRLSLSVPLMFWVTRYRSAPGMANDSALTYMLMTYPEITYKVTGNTSVGLAYYSANLLRADGHSATIKDGLEGGILQAVVTATL